MYNLLILHNIRSVLNVGAIFRTADAIGINKIYLTGYTPTPYDRFGRINYAFKKASVGAYEFVKWEQIRDVSTLINKLKKEHFKIFAIEQNEKSIDYKKVKLGDKNVFIFGNEIRGVSKQILNKVDKILEIPMRGKKESLNVSTSVGIVLFKILDK